MRPDWCGVLERAGLRTVADFLAESRGEVIRRKPTGEVRRIELGGDGAIFVKVHRYVWPAAQVVGLLKGNPPVLSEVAEWRALTEVREALAGIGVRVPEPVAYGARFHRFRRERFIATEGLTGYVPLDSFLAEGRGSLAVTFRRALARAVGALVSTLHARSIYHRDLYLCHLLLRMGPAQEEIGKGIVDLALIDLTRCRRRSARTLVGRLLAERARVKDLAALDFSAAPPGGVALASAADRLSFLQAYLGGARLSRRSAVGREARRLAARTRRKVARMARHGRKG